MLHCVVMVSDCQILTVNLIAFSGATPTSCGAKPLYNPRNPSWRSTFLKQSKLFLYIISPTTDVLWFCILVLTRSMGYTAVAPVARKTSYFLEMKSPIKKGLFDGKILELMTLVCMQSLLKKRKFYTKQSIDR